MASLTLKYIIGASTLAIFMSGCAVAPGLTDTEKELSSTMDRESFQPAPRALRDSIETQELLAQAAFWMREYELNPADLEAAIKLSAVIRKVGNPQRAVEITQTSRALYPRNPYLTAEYAAALIASERSLDAMKPLDEALRYAPAYGRLWSLKGAALDQQGQYEPARQHYNRALQITPNDPSVMANMGLSYALSGDSKTAEQWLRRAAADPMASQSVHQNLALVLQIQGKTEEANSIMGLAQKKSNGRLPNLNPQPAFVPQTQTSLRGQYNPHPNQPHHKGAQASQQAYTHTGFQSPAPVVTTHMSNSTAPNTQIYGSATPYSQAKTASDAARMAAAQSRARSPQSRPQTEVVTPAQKLEQQELLARIAQNARTPSSHKTSMAQPAPYYPGRAQQPSSNYGYAQATQAATPTQHIEHSSRRGASRARR